MNVKIRLCFHKQIFPFYITLHAIFSVLKFNIDIDYNMTIRLYSHSYAPF